MVQSDGQMFCPGTGFVVGCKIEATHVVFESTAFYFGCSAMNGKTVGMKIFKEMNDGNDLS